MVAEGDRPPLACDLLLGYRREGEQRWTETDTILYNLGIGFGQSAIGESALLRYLLADRLRGFPTMASVLGAANEVFHDPRYGVDFASVLHGEESIEILRPLPPAGHVRSVTRIDGLWDRGPGKGAIMTTVRTLTYAAAGEPVAIVRSTAMLRGNGGFGGTSEGAPRAAAMPDRAPDGAHTLPTRPEQALIYQLSGDRNPLHTVPEVARAAGFPGPILMGLCSYAISARSIVAALADGDEGRLGHVSVRFAGVVYPGETIRTEYWRLGDGEIAFRARAIERDAIVLTGGRATIA